MLGNTARLSRRSLMTGFVPAGFALKPLLAQDARRTEAADPTKALIAITLDLEMSRNFPTWEQTQWDYMKGNLDTDSKNYAVGAARRVKDSGGLVHFFAVGQVFEQEKVDWLEEIVRMGHPVGNHTYDHVNVLATKPEQIQFRFQRAPWLIHGKEPREVIADNIRLCTMAMKMRLGIAPAGFRTPGGFRNGLRDRADVQQILLSQGFPWVSSLSIPAPVAKSGEVPTEKDIREVIRAQELSQPFIYPSGLIEVPMSPMSDIHAFRNLRWKLEYFLRATRASVEWTIEHHAVYDLLSHPSCLGVVDPNYQTIDMICRLVREAGDRAQIVDLGTVAERAKLRGAAAVAD